VSIELNVPFDIKSCEVDGNLIKTKPGTRNLGVAPGTKKVVINAK